MLTVLELCAGGGGQTIGLERAGFHCVGAVEIEPIACETLKLNRPKLNVLNEDIRALEGRRFDGVDLLSGGVPCPPFSIAGKQLGADDERDLFPTMLRLVGEIRPRAVQIENVPGFASAKFEGYRNAFLNELRRLGYRVGWRVLQAADFGVPQLRPRFVLVAFRNDQLDNFFWPTPNIPRAHVGPALADLMMEHSWPGALRWADRAREVAPTIVGGSKKHGGPDLGPTRARRQWRELGVDGIGIADDAPAKNFPIDGLPRLTVPMVARLQGFPDDWRFAGRKTAAYRQVGNAFPPPVAAAVGTAINAALTLRENVNTFASAELLNTALLCEPSAKLPIVSRRSSKTKVTILTKHRKVKS